ncbi:GNAT family N-acetyltransferase [Halobacillus sp. BAB-2008]|uniref:GNAT family N-acetyltransferase n=1 Tax=Halobacillus sp. BAB-2008 TaxID=1246484 RepID=UPI0002A4DD82|nr:GNAT family N-acetyltransferase [Halobacillus sp. BAB-2008]ELK45670.1 GCN5-related N-acetyltransferase [Halobacillus sp. BAB-2008]
MLLSPMRNEEFHQYRELSVREYAEEKVRAGNWKEEEALEKSEEQFRQLLPDGVNTVDHYLFTMQEDGEAVGVIWLYRQTPEKGFIYDIKVDESKRGFGHGKRAMRALETEAEKLGLSTIGLHVFGHNKIARRLYEKLGYIETNISMEKKLPRDS